MLVLIPTKAIEEHDVYKLRIGLDRKVTDCIPWSGFSIHLSLYLSTYLSIMTVLSRVHIVLSCVVQLFIRSCIHLFIDLFR